MYRWYMVGYGGHHAQPSGGGAGVLPSADPALSPLLQPRVWENDKLFHQPESVTFTQQNQISLYAFHLLKPPQKQRYSGTSE